MPLVYIKDGKVEYRSVAVSTRPSFAFSFGNGNTGEYRDTWRVFRIMSEFVEGYQFLQGFQHEITIFGSARIKPNSAYYKKARALGRMLAEGGYTTITGGGPGLMEAANRGATEGVGESVGINIKLPHEQRVNEYVKKYIALHYFFTRKVMFATPAQAFVFFPGGLGTLDEFWEIIDLMENEYLTQSPLILVGKKFWEPLMNWLPNNAAHILTPREKEMLASCHLVEEPEEAYEIVKHTKDVKNVCELSPDKFSCEQELNWRIFRIMAEVVEGFDFLTGLVKDVTVLGTKGISKLSPYYKAAEHFGTLAAKAGFSVVTGGYSGIPEAANKGAFEHGGNSIGLFMRENRHNGRPNAYLSRSLSFSFPFTRKLILTAPSKGFVMFPGGLGTMHQTMEVLELMQTKKMPRVPVVLYGSKFWNPFAEFVHEVLNKTFKTIHSDDAQLFTIVDDPEEAMGVIESGYKE